MIFKFSYIKHNKFGRKGTINNNIDKTGFIYIKGYENLFTDDEWSQISSDGTCQN